MTKTILTPSQRALVNKVIVDARTGKIQKIAYWDQYTADEKNLLQAIFYTVDNGEINHEAVDDDLDEVINNLDLGNHNYWGIEHLPANYVADILEKGLDIFK